MTGDRGEAKGSGGSARGARPGRKALLAAALLGLVFAADVLIGKIAVLGGATTVPGLGDVGQFLVLFAAVVLFIVACLIREGDATSSK